MTSRRLAAKVAPWHRALPAPTPLDPAVERSLQRWHRTLRSLRPTPDAVTVRPDVAFVPGPGDALADVPPDVAATVAAHRWRRTVAATPLLTVHWVHPPRAVSAATVRRFVAAMHAWAEWLSTVGAPSRDCVTSRHCTVRVYWTSLRKTFGAETVLGPSNVNTAFAYACPRARGSIVLFRREEWFKVFVHETLHTWGVDRHAVTTAATRAAFGLPARANVLVSEAYTEWWAEVINVLLGAPTWAQAKRWLNVERAFSAWQLAQVLAHARTTLRARLDVDARPTPFAEASNVWAYYVWKGLLMVDWPRTAAWCRFTLPFDRSRNEAFGTLLRDIADDTHLVLDQWVARARPSPASTLRMSACEWMA